MKSGQRGKFDFRGLIDTIAGIFLIIGGLNWGSMGIFRFNVIEYLLVPGSLISRIFYVIVGVSALWMIADVFIKERH